MILHRESVRELESSYGKGVIVPMVAGSSDNGGCINVKMSSRIGRRLRNCAWCSKLGQCRRMGGLTEDSSRRIVTGETGLAHTRTGDSQL
jgi:hypothetical protein